MNNQIDAEISAADLTAMRQEFATMKSKMPFLIKLGEAERKSISKMDDIRRPFVEKSFQLGEGNAVIDPGPGLITAGKKDMALFIALTTIKNELEQFLEMITDTRQLAGAEAYETARFIYMKAQMAVKMNQPGTQSIVDELGKLFKQQSAGPDAKTP